MDLQTGVIRRAFGALYRWYGVPRVPVALGFYAIPEIVGLVITRTSISDELDEAGRGVAIG